MPRVGLVLGAGGVVGLAYHTAALTALAGVSEWDPGTAEIIVGTSAGSAIGSSLRGGVGPPELMDRLLSAPADPEAMARLRTVTGRDQQSRRLLPLLPLPAAPRLLVCDMLRPWRTRPGRALAALLPEGRIPTELVGERPRELHGLEWPSPPLWVCAMRLSDGERVVFGLDRLDIDVGTAVRASSAIPGFFQPVHIDGDRYVDGGAHSPTNADLLVDQKLDLVVVLSPMSGSRDAILRPFQVPTRLQAKLHLRSEVAALKRAGHEVLVIEPGREETRVMGATAMDPTRIMPVVLQSSASVIHLLARRDLQDKIEMLKAA